MMILNLVNLEQSDIKYKISRFPDGQQQVTILGYLEQTYPSRPDTITINSRLNNFIDLELIICATKSLENWGCKNIHLYTPYFLGSRSDRQFEEDSNNYLKDVICPIINSLNFKLVTVLDSHSHVLEACLKNFKSLSNLDLIRWVSMNEPFCKGNFNDSILVSPDAGASHKIYKLAEQIGYKGDIITCSKERDNEGKLTLVNVPTSGLGIGNKDLIIIDDICDGGATFINIAKEIKTKRTNKIYLIVTHGIFSKGFKELSEYFDGIYCTNSYIDIITDHGYTPKIEKHSSLVKQLNVF